MAAGGLVGAAEEDRSRLAELLGQRQELEGGLAHRAVDVVDDNQDFRHVSLHFRSALR